jgi:Rrf2 family protein
MAQNGSGRWSARDLAAQVGVPVRVLTNLLNQLTHRGLVVSSRGTNGGYRLARSADKITLAALVEAVEGPIQLTRCCPTGFEVEEQECERVGRCVVKGSMHSLNASLRGLLGGITLRDLASSKIGRAGDLAVRQREGDLQGSHEAE